MANKCVFKILGRGGTSDRRTSGGGEWSNHASFMVFSYNRQMSPNFHTVETSDKWLGCWLWQHDKSGRLTHPRGGNNCWQTSTVEMGSKSIWHTNRHEPKPRTNKQINSQRVQFECYWGWGAGCDNMTSQADWHTLGVKIIVDTSTVELGSGSIWHTNRQEAKPRTNKQTHRESNLNVTGAGALVGKHLLANKYSWTG